MDRGPWTKDGGPCPRFILSRLSLARLSMWVSSPIRRPSRLYNTSHRDRDLARGEIYARNLIKMAVVIGIPRELIAATMGVLLDLGKMGDAI